MEMNISRRMLLKAGLSAAFLSLVPDIAFAGDLSSDENGVIGPGSLPDSIYKPRDFGKVDSETMTALSLFAKLAIEAWDFKDAAWDERKDISKYLSRLEYVINLKTDPGDDKKNSQTHSYLAEYKSAAGLIIGAQSRLGAGNAAFVHLMFAGREMGDELRAPRLIRARRFVFDELTRHILSNVGFRSLGLVNFEGYVGGSLYDPKAFRRGKA